MTCFRFEDGRTIHKWCLDNDIPYDYFYRRIDKGMTFEQAIKECASLKNKIKPGTRMFFIYNNILYEGSFLKEDGDYYIMRKTSSKINKKYRVPKNQVARKTQWDAIGKIG